MYIYICIYIYICMLVYALLLSVDPMKPGRTSSTHVQLGLGLSSQPRPLTEPTDQGYMFWTTRAALKTSKVEKWSLERDEKSQGASFEPLRRSGCSGFGLVLASMRCGAF